MSFLRMQESPKRRINTCWRYRYKTGMTANNKFSYSQGMVLDCQCNHINHHSDNIKT